MTALGKDSRGGPTEDRVEPCVCLSLKFCWKYSDQSDGPVHPQQYCPIACWLTRKPQARSEELILAAWGLRISFCSRHRKNAVWF